MGMTVYRKMSWPVKYRNIKPTIGREVILSVATAELQTRFRFCTVVLTEIPSKIALDQVTMTVKFYKHYKYRILHHTLLTNSRRNQHPPSNIWERLRR
jgi:hypothetical protein